MSNKKLISKFIVSVYEDGSFSTERIHEKTEKITSVSIPNSGLSQRIKQALEVYQQMAVELNKGNDKKSAFNNAISEVATKNGVESNTVIDKITRQAGLQTNQVRDMIFDQLQGTSTKYSDLLYDKVGAHTSEADKKAIDNIFK